MTNCLCFEFPYDNRIEIIIKILEKYNVDYLRYYFYSFCPPNRIKFILFHPKQLVIYEIVEYTKFEYKKEDYMHQSSFQLTDNERKVLIDLALK